MKKLDNKTALITGATGGIGLETARLFVAEGANVMLCDLDEKALAALAAELGDKAAYCVCNVTSEDDNRRAFEATVKRFGRVDIGVLNAGIEGVVAPIGEMKVADFDKVIAVNVRGVFLGLTQLMPAMKAQGGGSIIVLSSVAGVGGAAGLSPYITSKHAVIGLMRSAAIEGGPFKVRVNTVNPGPTETRMMRSIEAGSSPADPEAARQALAANIPMQRYGQPIEVARMIAFLGSEDASYCSGNTYFVDGAAVA